MIMSFIQKFIKKITKNKTVIICNECKHYIPDINPGVKGNCRNRPEIDIITGKVTYISAFSNRNSFDAECKLEGYDFEKKD